MSDGPFPLLSSESTSSPSLSPEFLLALYVDSIGFLEKVYRKEPGQVLLVNVDR